MDNGYDIADYLNIDPAYGTMTDFEALLGAAHARGIRIVMDIVVNHTSTEHAWFKSALGDKNSPYRDYYIWKDPVDGGVPNNWQSKFGGSAWELDPATGQYYLHLFAREQADLNWENPAVRRGEKDHPFLGEEGSTVSASTSSTSSPRIRRSLTTRWGWPPLLPDGPRIHEFLQDVSRDVFAPWGHDGGEMSSTSLEHCQRYGALDGSELSMVFNFHHLKVDYPGGDKWTRPRSISSNSSASSTTGRAVCMARGGRRCSGATTISRASSPRFGDEDEHRGGRRQNAGQHAARPARHPYIYQGRRSA